MARREFLTPFVNHLAPTKLIFALSLWMTENNAKHQTSGLILSNYKRKLTYYTDLTTHIHMEGDCIRLGKNEYVICGSPAFLKAFIMDILCGSLQFSGSKRHNPKVEIPLLQHLK